MEGNIIQTSILASLSRMKSSSQTATVAPKVHTASNDQSPYSCFALFQAIKGSSSDDPDNADRLRFLPDAEVPFLVGVLSAVASSSVISILISPRRSARSHKLSPSDSSLPSAELSPSSPLHFPCLSTSNFLISFLYLAFPVLVLNLKRSRRRCLVCRPSSRGAMYGRGGGGI